MTEYIVPFDSEKTDEVAIEIKNLGLVYESENSIYEALKDINLDIKKGEFICIVGQSGCGKSTLLSVLEGLNKATSGTVKINGRNISGPGVERAVVFQNYSLFPWMTARENVSFAVYETMKKKGEKISHKAADEIADDFLKKVELNRYEDKLPGELSGGMQQRVAIARAMACNPEILLMDEPFGALDAKIRENLQALLLKLWREDEKKKTVVFVTHDLNEAILLADKIVFMMPLRIHSVIDVDIPRPRVREAVYESPEYKRLSKKLNHLFYNEVTSFVNDNEVVI
ncbi:MAG: ABC transporter ATP-binding protein [Treponema sp.]|uniref:ABC transporter ATP-binding protein n=1 Tax=Treponema sp. TaxID=166 RepID=UPI0025F42537|nr:ABC transporter ATP-binding protein [Treponema sp.]MBQ8679713.1 ABC transporter ATP-binding protein [Treponema sp.]